MATVAHGRTSSNNQRGTVGLSAGDYIRLKRLQAFSSERNYATTIAENTDVDVPTFPQTAYSIPFLKAKHTGSSRIRRTNEQWINYRASQTADRMEYTNVNPCQMPRLPVARRLCDCSEEVIEPGPKLAGGKCCIGKAALREEGGPIFVGTDITVTGLFGRREYRIYTFVPPSSGTYTITLFDIDGSDPDLFISYPDELLDRAQIAVDDGGPTALYSAASGGTDTVSDFFEGGRTYEVMALMYDPDSFRLTVTD
jgi:hypothetical protein